MRVHCGARDDDLIDAKIRVEFHIPTRPYPTKSKPPSTHGHHSPPANCHPSATMGITDFFSDVWETFSHPSPDAEAPPQGGTSTDTPASGTDEQSDAEAEVNKEDAKDGGESEEQGHKPSDDDDEEEEEEEELQDPKDVLEKGE